MGAGVPAEAQTGSCSSGLSEVEKVSAYPGLPGAPSSSPSPQRPEAENQAHKALREEGALLSPRRSLESPVLDCCPPYASRLCPGAAVAGGLAGGVPQPPPKGLHGCLEYSAIFESWLLNTAAEAHN